MDPDAISELIQYGVLGFIVMAIILGWVVPGKTHERETSRADRLEEENQRIRDRVEEKVVPLVQRAITALERDLYRAPPPPSPHDDHEGE